MNITFKYENKDFKKYANFIQKFTELLQREFPLKNDLRIFFLNQQKGEMSTGSRRSDNTIKVLVGDRMNRDIMRTLAHEWVHEHQMDVLKRKKGPDIGGQNEDEANAFAGRLIKMFEKENPEMEQLMYEHKGINNKLLILEERIIKEQKNETKNSLLVEMKKIGIEKLPYSYSSLKKFIDSKTMNVHYNKHYKGYVEKLNKALRKKDYGDLELEQIVKSISKFNDTIRNNAGGAFNHAMFWKMLSPKKQSISGSVLQKIKKDFGSYEKFKKEFEQVAKDRFGSGWVWLILTKNNKLKIVSTPNQDNPLMNDSKEKGYPILGLDLWEHAYYLKYQNKRDEYIENFWDVVNWTFVNKLLDMKLKTKLNESLNLKKILRDDTKEDLRESIRVIFNLNPKVKSLFETTIKNIFKNNGSSLSNKIGTSHKVFSILLEQTNNILEFEKKQKLTIVGLPYNQQINETIKFLLFLEENKNKFFDRDSQTLKKIISIVTNTKQNI